MTVAGPVGVQSGTDLFDLRLVKYGEAGNVIEVGKLTTMTHHARYYITNWFLFPPSPRK